MEGNDEVHRFFSNQGFTREYLNYNLIAYKPPEPIWQDGEYKNSFFSFSEYATVLSVTEFGEYSVCSRWLKYPAKNLR